MERPPAELPQDGEDSPKISRRDFLKKAAFIGGGIVAAGLGVGKYKDDIIKGVENIQEQRDRHEAELTHEGEGVVVEKKRIPGSAPLDPLGIKPFTVAGMLTTADTWLISVQVDQKVGSIPVTKEEFDTYNEGDKIFAVYKESRDKLGKFLSAENEVLIKSIKKDPSS